MSVSKLIVITGTNRGLGRAMARQFAAEGHVVIGCGRSEEGLKQVRMELPGAHRFSQVDVTQDDQVKRWAQETLHEVGTPDLLINNAAIINDNRPLWNVPPEEFEHLMAVNVQGVFHVLRHFVPAMITRGSGVIVNFSSGWGRSTSPQVGPYCCSKWAVEGLTRALADELPHGLAAIPLNPGVINTEMLQTCFGESASNYPSPEDWARTAVPFLLDLSPADNGDALTAPGP